MKRGSPSLAIKLKEKHATLCYLTIREGRWKWIEKKRTQSTLCSIP
jgi:hypothetical protein